MLVVGLFAAAFLIGVLWFVIGIGDAIDHREALQDPADSGAYAAAVMHARAMNLIALLNMVKLSVVAISVALLSVMMAALQTISWILSSRTRRIRYGWTIPFLVAVHAQAANHFASTRSDVETAVRAADEAQRTLRDRLPEIAERRAQEIAESYPPPVRAGFLAPYQELPVEEGSVRDFCVRMLPYAYSIEREAFSSVPSGTVRGRARRYAEGNTVPICVAQGVRPMKVRDGVHLGDEPYQLRFYALGDTMPGTGEYGVKMATWRADEPGGDHTRLRDLIGTVGLAQAEYYFDGTQRRSEMLWEMEWHARFRRYRMPPEGMGAAEDACQEAGGSSCGALTDELANLEGVFTH